MSAVTVQYRLRRRDMWRAYWFAWRNGWVLKASQVMMAGVMFFAVFVWRNDVAMASLAAVAIVVWLPLYPLLRFRPQTRTLTITPEGISTHIESRWFREEVWSRINSIERRGDRLYLMGHGANLFGVADRAFPSDAERDAFEEQARTWWQAARAS